MSACQHNKSELCNFIFFLAVVLKILHIQQYRARYFHTKLLRTTVWLCMCYFIEGEGGWFSSLNIEFVSVIHYCRGPFSSSGNRNVVLGFGPYGIEFVFGWWQDFYVCEKKRPNRKTPEKLLRRDEIKWRTLWRVQTVAKLMGEISRALLICSTAISAISRTQLVLAVPSKLKTILHAAACCKMHHLQYVYSQGRQVAVTIQILTTILQNTPVTLAK